VGEGIVLKLRRIGGGSVAEAYCGSKAEGGDVGLRLYDMLLLLMHRLNRQYRSIVIEAISSIASRRALKTY
jgi:hypothetical protein